MRRAVTAAGRHLARVEELISRALLALLVLLVFVPAVTRTFNRPIIWSIEIAQLLFAWLAFLGANQAMRAGAHIGVDVLTRHLPPRLRKAVALFNLGLIAAFLAALLWYGIELTFVSVDRRFMTTNLSFAFATVAAPLGAALLLLTTTGRIAAVLRGGPDAGEGNGEGRDEGGDEGRDEEGTPGANPPHPEMTMRPLGEARPGVGARPEPGTDRHDPHALGHARLRDHRGAGAAGTWPRSSPGCPRTRCWCCSSSSASSWSRGCSSRAPSWCCCSPRLLVPIVRQLGIDDVHFGVLMVILVGLGSMTPPVGVIMYTVCGLLNVKTDQYVRESLPFILAILVLITILALLPDLVLFLSAPRLWILSGGILSGGD